MFPYYQFLYNFQPQPYGFENSSPIMTWNCGSDFQYIKLDENISSQMNVSNQQLDSTQLQIKNTIDHLQFIQEKQ